MQKYEIDFFNTLLVTAEGRLLLHEIVDGIHENIPQRFVGNILEVSIEEELQDDDGNGDMLTTSVADSSLGLTLTTGCNVVAKLTKI